MHTPYVNLYITKLYIFLNNTQEIKNNLYFSQIFCYFAMLNLEID